MAFNTKEFAWSNVEVAMLGRVLTRIRGVKYSAKKEKEFLHARGEDPHAIQSGLKTYEGELMMLQSELEAIQKQLDDTEDITDLEAFNVTIVYKPKGAGSLVTHILKNVEFTEDPRDIDTTKKFQELSLPIMFLGREAIQ